MKAIQIRGGKLSPRICNDGEVEKPTPQRNQILVQVHAAGITGDEIGWPEVWDSPHCIPGHEISGVIEAFGPEYGGDFETGQDVFAFIGVGTGAGQAEYVLCLPEEIAVKPKSLSHAEAAALPIPILTAQQALFDHALLQPGMSLLVTGASGAVGLQAVQLGARAGVNVTALASEKNHALLKTLGAIRCLDYHDDWYAQISDVDVVFDTAGSSMLDHAWTVVKSNGTIVTVADPAPAWASGGVPEELASHPDVRHIYFILSPDTKKLQEFSEMLDNGQLQALKVASFPWSRAVEAWEVARQRGRGSKAVLLMGNA